MSALVIGLLILLLPICGDIMKNIQISYDLFRSLCDYFFTSDYTGASWLADDIRSELRHKQERLNAREIFSRYKTSSGQERENARKEYLDAADILEDFRTAAEVRQSAPPDDLD